VWIIVYVDLGVHDSLKFIQVNTTTIPKHRTYCMFSDSYLLTVHSCTQSHLTPCILQM